MPSRKKICVSPCKGITQPKCTQRFCNYVNKKRKYCTLNRKSYLLKSETTGCNIYPKKKQISRVQPGVVVQSVKNKLMGKLQLARTHLANKKEVSSTYKKKTAARTIKRFMRNPQVREKMTANFLQTICSDAGVCIAFGTEANKIKAFFNNFTDFTYLTAATTIGKPSLNGIITELQYERRNYIAHAVLKCPTEYDSDNLMYEYFVGQAVNEFMKIVPCFVETYGLALFDNENRLKFYDPRYDIGQKRNTKNQLPIIKEGLTFFNKVELDYDKLDIACEKSINCCLLVQHLKGCDTMGDAVQKNNAHFCDNYLISILYTLYFSLDILKDKFTHYDLHSENVLLYMPNPKKYIHYIFHKGNETIEFKSCYLPKIIDYGRSFFHMNSYKNSSKIYEKVCTFEECLPDCGGGRGFRFLKPGFSKSFTEGTKRNNSHDLRLLNHINLNQYLKRKKSSSDNRLITNTIESFLKNVYFTGQYGTKEQIQPLTDSTKIYNITDAMNRLGDILKKDNIPKVNYAEGSYGELHIYHDQTPMKFIKA